MRRCPRPSVPSFSYESLFSRGGRGQAGTEPPGLQGLPERCRKDDTVSYLSGLLHAERRRRGTRKKRQALTCFRQAVLVLR